jgi:hypothetical protein
MACVAVVSSRERWNPRNRKRGSEEKNECCPSAESNRVSPYRFRVKIMLSGALTVEENVTDEDGMGLAHGVPSLWIDTKLDEKGEPDKEQRNTT